MPPTAPLCRISPVPAARVRFPPPSMVLEKVMFWLAAAVVISTFPEIATASAKETGPPEVICPAKALVPAPVWLKAPEEVKTIPEERVKSPEFAMAIGPAPVVVALALKVKLVPVKLIPVLDVVLTAPWKVVVPLPLFCVTNKALMAGRETFPPEVMVTPPSGVVPPIAPDNVIAFVPAARVNDWTPAAVALTVPDKVMSPTPFCINPLIELSAQLPVKVIALEKEISPLFVVIDPPMLTGPAPF